MCLINFQWKAHKHYPLIIAANRDEFYERPTAPAHFWEDEPELLAGRDLVQKGTWLGITKQGKFAALTNFRDPQQIDPGKASRGEIVKQFLTEDWSPKEFVESLREHRESYTGYNVIAGTLDEMYHYNNVHNELNKVNPGAHGLSNDSLNTPWPKVIKGKQTLNVYATQASEIKTEPLFQMLSDTEQAPVEELPATGIDPDFERQLSPLFIHTENYGTRASTVLLIDNQKNVTFVERRFNEGVFTGEQSFSFRVSHS
ncbi:NRDE family protein [Salicibibacter halophilus]|uniref:NRDE family protein n=1 Tax=Salicibibacter halophilus TaxID=2502791 RepID=A0A514LKN5_9BACI|nr:NRDE family protein [Salicibibacter halophilus]QDI92392.1 NRDE family protein [Salicibibacter halophilus]